MEFVIFRLGEEEYGASIAQVREIRQMMELTLVPRSPEYVAGVVNLRGGVIPVIDLRTLLGLPPKDQDKDTRIIIFELGQGESTQGVIVDSVSEVLTIEDVRSPMVDQPWMKGIGQMGDRLIIICDFEPLLMEKTYMLNIKPLA